MNTNPRLLWMRRVVTVIIADLKACGSNAVMDAARDIYKAIKAHREASNPLLWDQSFGD